MKKEIISKLLLIIFICTFSSISNAQNIGVEKSILGIQTGLLGGWIYNEYKISNKIVLRSEVGINSTVYISSGSVEYSLVPEITLEPKLYYNINKRKLNSSDISYNSANYISLRTSYHAGWFLMKTDDHLSIKSQFAIMPTWGIRRNIGTHLNFESGIGAGYGYPIYKSADTTINFNINIHFRIEYKF